MEAGYRRITASKLGAMTVRLSALPVWRSRSSASGISPVRALRWAALLSLLAGFFAFAGPGALPSVSQAQTPSPILGVFEGTTPCHNIPKPLPQIPAHIDCELMTWKLTLNQVPNSGAPATFTLSSAYGLTQPNTRGIRGGGTKVEMEGRWAIFKGTNTDLSAVVYQLNPDNPSRSVSFLKLDDYLLQLLGRDRGLVVGNAAWSYTLNRTDKARRESSPPKANPPSRPATAPLPTGLSTYGVFEGRTACGEVALQFTRFPASECTIIKWRLTLYQDPNTGAPTTFTFKGTRAERAGTWRIARGAKANPAAVLYQLDPDKPQQSASFLKADDNTLLLLDREMNLIVGDLVFSNTLSRADSLVSSCFSETGLCLRGAFWRYWEGKGGLAQFGFPISAELVEDGRIVQYTERARLEWHPANQGTDYDVLVGRLGAKMVEARTALREVPFQRVGEPTDSSVRYFPETGHTLAAPLRAYWEGNGGLPVFGYPLSEAFQERSATDGKTYLVQYFERNRLEYHPEYKGTPNEVLLGLLGVQEYERRYK